MRRSWKFAAVAVPGLALCVALAGCKEGETGLRFSHALHAKEAGCPDCHGGEGLKTGMDPCKACHDIDVDHPSKACLTCHTRPEARDYRVTPPKPGPAYADLIFDHDVHSDVDCGTCHRGIERVESLGAVTFPAMEACLECHNGTEAPSSCSTCHKVLRRDVKPASHGGLWPKRHGKIVGLEEKEEVCAYCHPGRDACRTCHQESKPQSHTAGWKYKSHGLEARHDRDNCVECHMASFCSDCHQERPRSHSPREAWLASGHRIQGAVSAESCSVCHRPTDPACLQCHPRGF